MIQLQALYYPMFTVFCCQQTSTGGAQEGRALGEAWNSGPLPAVSVAGNHTMAGTYNCANRQLLIDLIALCSLSLHEERTFPDALF